MASTRYVVEFVGQPSGKKGSQFIAGYLDKKDVQALCQDLGIKAPRFATDAKAVKATLEADGEDTDGADLECAFFASREAAQQLAEKLDASDLEPPAVAQAGIDADLVYGVRTATWSQDGTISIQ